MSEVIINVTVRRMKMSIINTGGAAFPNAVPNEYQYASCGMTLRDYFAGQALAGAGEVDYVTIEIMAKRCYEIADAMLAERATRGEQ